MATAERSDPLQIPDARPRLHVLNPPPEPVPVLDVTLDVLVPGRYRFTLVPAGRRRELVAPLAAGVPPEHVAVVDGYGYVAFRRMGDA